MLENEKEYVIGDYLEWLEENVFENTEENMELYIAGLYYDLVDNMYLFEEQYKELQEMINIADKTDFIENIIKNILKKRSVKKYENCKKRFN